MDRFGQTIIEADAEQAVAFLGQRIGRQRDDGCMGQPPLAFAGADLLRGLHTAEDRHIDIHENQIIAAPGAELAGHAAIFGLFDAGAMVTEQCADQFAIDGTVVGDEYPQSGQGVRLLLWYDSRFRRAAQRWRIRVE